MVEKISGRVISVLGAKGGVGQTLIATNLAVSLKEESDQRVALLDLGLHPGGGAASLLGLTLKKSLVDLVPFMERLDGSLLKGYLTSHSSGIDLLTSISDVSQAKKVLPQYIEKIIRSSRSVYDYVIIATEKEFTDNLITTFDNSDLIFLIVTPDLLSLNQAKQTLATFQSLHFPPQIVKIVVNMSDVKNAVPLPKIKSHLGNGDIFGEISYDGPVVFSSINEGEPAVMTNPHSPFSKGIQKLAFLLLQENQRYIKEKKGLFAQVTGRSEKYRLRQEKAISPAEEIEDPPKGEKKEKKPVWGKEVITLKLRIHKKLIDELDLKKLDLKEAALDPRKKAKIREAVKGVVEGIVAREGKILPSRLERTKLIMEILDEALGLGPLEDLLRDATITEIMVTGKDKIYVERGGKLSLTNKKFASDRQLMGVIERIVAPLGRRIDESSPLVDARLSDGSRVNAVIPPLSLIGPTLTIRKFPEKGLTPQDLVKFGTISSEMVEFLRVCVQARKNIIISGGTGSGKTTLLNICSSFIPHDERIVTIEDSAELRLPQDHVVPLESRPPNIEGKGAIPIRRLVINALRMRPDRIVVGECRGGEALDMLQAMNTGHDGSLTTVHANTPRDSLIRLETMVLMAGMELPIKAIREQIKGAINIIVQQARFLDGSRKVTSITEITGFEGDVITLAEIFKYKQTGVDEKTKVRGEFMATGLVPTFLEDVKARGLTLDLGIFQPRKKAKK